MELIDKAKVIQKLKDKQNTFDVSLSPVQLAVYEGLLIAEDVVKAIPEVPKNVEYGIPYDRLFFLAKKMHKWINEHSFDENKEFKKIGLTAQENKEFGYAGGLTISAIDGKQRR